MSKKVAKDASTAEMKKIGRPCGYSPELVAPILARISAGDSVHRICSKKGMPSEDAFYGWLARYPEFAEKYARAKDIGLTRMADEILAIADDGSNDYVETELGQIVDHEHIQRSRLRVDTRKWILSKLAPKKYGDRLEVKADIDVTAHPAKLEAIQGLSQADLEKAIEIAQKLKAAQGTVIEVVASPQLAN